MNCKSTTEMLSAYLDRELAPQERDAIRSHLADCERCRCEERELRSLKGLLLGVRAPEPADDFEQRLMMRLRAEANTPARTRFTLPSLRLREPLAWGPFVGLAACAAMGTFAFIHMPQSVSVQAAPRASEPQVSVAQNDYNSYADRYRAYSAGDDPTASFSLLSASNGP